MYIVDVYHQYHLCVVLAVIPSVSSLTMAPANDQVYSSSIQTEGNTEKPTFRDGDKALDFLRTEAEVGEGEDIDEKKLVWKIDKMVVPLMFCCYLLQYLDKSLLNYAGTYLFTDQTIQHH